MGGGRAGTGVAAMEGGVLVPVEKFKEKEAVWFYLKVTYTKHVHYFFFFLHKIILRL